MREPGLALALACGLGLFGPGCAVEYSDEFPAGLDDDVPELAEDDVLVYERQLRWWISPTIQRVGLWRRPDGSYLLLRRRWQGPQVYGWAKASLSDAGLTRLDNGLALVDLEATAPVAGDYDCTFVETLPAVIIVDGVRVEYLTQCPPEGLVTLAALYEDMVELLLECPLDGGWYEGALPVANTDCDAYEG